MSELLKQFGPKNVEGFKQYDNPFNPFNSWKVMFHAERMWHILQWLKRDSEYLPPPVYVTVDPTDVCNHGCPWCISSQIQESDNTTLKYELLTSLAQILEKWQFERFGVNAVVVAGGGEPLVNPATKEFLMELSRIHRSGRPFEFSMITNGELLTDDLIVQILSTDATWVGVSIDAGNTEDHRKMHAPKKRKDDVFQKVIDNVQNLCEKRKRYSEIKSIIRKTPLNVGYKFNIHPDSVNSMLQGAEIAKKIGCDEIQFKPTFVDNAVEIMPPIIEQAQENIMDARKWFEDDTFKVHGMIHKFGPAWEPDHSFGVCTMTPLGLIFSADGNMYLCCDRRGDPKLKLGRWHDGKEAKLELIQSLWGSELHREMIEKIKLEECPRCSFTHYNKAAQQAFLKDGMNRNFL